MHRIAFLAQVAITAWLISRGATAEQNWILATLGLFLWLRILFSSSRKRQIVFTFSVWYLVAIISLDWLKVLGIDAQFALSFLVALTWTIAILIWQQINQIHQSNLMRAFSLASVIVLFEWILSNYPFGGFNWLRVAYLWADSPFVTLTYWFGISFLTFLIIFVSSFLASNGESSWKKLIVAAVVIAAIPISNSFHHRYTDQSGPGLRIAAIQGSVPEVGLDFNAQRTAVFRNHLNETNRFLSNQIKDVDLILWPENSVDIDPFVNADVGVEIQELNRVSGLPILFGAVLREGEWLSNSAVIAENGQVQPIYQKRKLVPFGEYLPFRNLLAPIISRFDRLSTDFKSGGSSDSVKIGGRKIGILICYEVAFDQLWHSYGTNSDYVVVMTNNATYGGTKQPWQQLNITRLQAVANGRNVVIASTSGISAVINANGRVEQIISRNQPGTLLADVSTVSRKAPSTNLNPVFNYTLLIVISILYLGFLRKKFTRRSFGPAVDYR